MKRSSSQSRFAQPMLLMCCVLTLLLGSGRTSFAASAIPCVGDCGADDAVTIEELIKGVNIALGTAPLSECDVFDADGDGSVTVNEIIKGVNKALAGCFEAVIASPQLAGTTDVVYDSIGVPHIYGPDLNSVTYVQGYVHAAHRFWLMDVSRRWGEGRLTELFGAGTLTGDVAMRTLLTTRDGRRMEEAMWERIQATDSEIAAAIEAYAAGVNAWLADLRAGHNGVTLPPEYEALRIGPGDLPPWRPQDSVIFDIAGWWDMDSWILSDTMSYAELWETLDDAARKDVLRPAPFV